MDRRVSGSGSATGLAAVVGFVLLAVVPAREARAQPWESAWEAQAGGGLLLPAGGLAQVAGGGGGASFRLSRRVTDLFWVSVGTTQGFPLGDFIGDGWRDTGPSVSLHQFSLGVELRPTRRKPGRWHPIFAVEGGLTGYDSKRTFVTIEGRDYLIDAIADTWVHAGVRASVEYVAYGPLGLFAASTVRYVDTDPERTATYRFATNSQLGDRSTGVDAFGSFTQFNLELGFTLSF